jgi:hypothetical protein
VDQDGNGNVVTYNGSFWSAPVSIDTGSALASVSCPTASFCAAVDADGKAFTYNAASWSAPLSIAADALTAVACATASSCVAVDSSEAFTYPMQDASTTTTTPPPTASTTTTVPSQATTTIVRVSSGQAGEPVSIGVKIAGPIGITESPSPAGLVIVTDGARNCVATLDGTNGTSTGTCSITELSAGRYWLTASYLGDVDFDPSVTLAPTPFTVTKASSTTMLKLSAVEVTYGREQVEHFSVVVSPLYSGMVPNGTVLVMKSTTTLCTITLRSAKGSCSLASKELPPRSFSVYADYVPNASFLGSTSFEAKTDLTVVK